VQQNKQKAQIGTRRASDKNAQIREIQLNLRRKIKIQGKIKAEKNN
jgi:hypothetical protein